jgi:hypothetical protein
MEYTRSSAGKMQLDEYVDVVNKIYGANDKYRSIWDVWSHTLHHAAGIAESVRKSAPPEKLFNEIADCALWLFTAIHRLSGKMTEPEGQDNGPPETLIRIQSGCSDLVWHRYPAVCHTCYLRRTEGNRANENEATFAPCDCLVHPDNASYSKDTKRRALESLWKVSEERLDKKPKTMDQWQEMFGQVFSATIDRVSLTDLALHFMEELGEASDAMIRMYSYKDKGHDADFNPGEPRQRRFRLEAQVADAFSRLFAIVEKINRSVTNCDFRRELYGSSLTTSGPILLSAVLWRRYGQDDLKSFWCRFCKNIVCNCQLVFVPANRSVEELLGLLKP